jgi:hypothetical protein
VIEILQTWTIGPARGIIIGKNRGCRSHLEKIRGVLRGTKKKKWARMDQRGKNIWVPCRQDKDTVLELGQSGKKNWVEISLSHFF